MRGNDGGKGIAGDKGGKGTEVDEGKKGRNLGGVRTTPVRAVEAGAFKMEVWVEEGREKVEMERARDAGLGGEEGVFT